MSLFFFHHPPPTELSTLSLHDALPISSIAIRQLDRPFRLVPEEVIDRARGRSLLPGQAGMAGRAAGSRWKRSEERRVGKEWRARWGAGDEKKKVTSKTEGTASTQ